MSTTMSLDGNRSPIYTRKRARGADGRVFTGTRMGYGRWSLTAQDAVVVTTMQVETSASVPRVASLREQIGRFRTDNSRHSRSSARRHDSESCAVVLEGRVDE